MSTNNHRLGQCSSEEHVKKLKSITKTLQEVDSLTKAINVEKNKLQCYRVIRLIVNLIKQSMNQPVTTTTKWDEHKK